jgi:hypothetical protein
MKRISLAMFTALCASAVGYAQIEGPPPPDGPLPMGGPPHGHGPGGPGSFMHPGKVITGAPYSATATDQVSQTLADGNTIQRTTTAQVARDSRGRTYTQHTMTGGPWAAEGSPRTVSFIFDPVAGYSYVLHADKKVAIRRPINVPPGGEEPGKNFEAKPRHGGPGSEKNVTEADLGSKDFPGAGAASGKSITHTIPAGEIGNAQPIVSTNEIWYSPDLQIVVLSKHSDPRMGESTHTLSNIQRGEPNPSLFQVPSGYSVQDASNAHGHHGPPE